MLLAISNTAVVRQIMSVISSLISLTKAMNSLFLMPVDRYTFAFIFCDVSGQCPERKGSLFVACII